MKMPVKMMKMKGER